MEPLPGYLRGPGVVPLQPHLVGVPLLQAVTQHTLTVVRGIRYQSTSKRRGCTRSPGRGCPRRTRRLAPRSGTASRSLRPLLRACSLSLCGALADGDSPEIGICLDQVPTRLYYTSAPSTRRARATARARREISCGRRAARRARQFSWGARLRAETARWEHLCSGEAETAASLRPAGTVVVFDAVS